MANLGEITDLYLALAGLAFSFSSLVLALFSNLATLKSRLLVASGAFAVVLLICIAFLQVQERFEVDAARADVEALLMKNGAMTFEDIYAKISPRRDLDVLTTAINSGLRSKSIAAKPEQATSSGNELVGIRLYTKRNGS